MLRVYDPFQTPNAQVIVRFWAEWLVNNVGAAPGSSQPPQILGTRTLTLHVRPTASSEVNVEPGYAEFPINRDVLSNLPAYSSNIVVEVEPVTPGLRFWAFVTVTDNETQHVLTITPH
jgi:hypothetical protein